MNLANATNIRAPAGDVVRIADTEGRVLWEHSGVEDYRNVYQPVAYIASPGGDEGGWIETDFIDDGIFHSFLLLQASFDTLEGDAPMGSRTIGEDYDEPFFVPYPVSATTIQYASGGIMTDSYSCTTGINYTLYNAAGSPQIYAIGQPRYYKNDHGAIFRQKGPVGIFRYLNSDGIHHGARRPMKVYGAEIARGIASDIVRKYKPCYRKSDGVVGLYELYTRTFLTTPEGVLTAGPKLG